MRKRFLCLLMAGIMTASALAGCGAEEEENNNDNLLSTIFTGELERNVTIRVLENDTAIERGYFDELINAFNEKYKEYGIVAVDANMDQYLDLANDGPYGYGPDVLYQANDILMKYVDGKHIYPLPVDKLECYDKVPKEAWDAYKADVDGQTYYCAVPVNVQSGLLYYRKDLLPDNWKETYDDNENDIPDMVENFNDLYKFSLERHSNDSTKYGYMKSLYDVYFSSGFLFTYGAYVFGGNNTNPDDIGFDKGESAKGAQVLSQLASVMNEECIDDTITTNCYSKLADGTYFATISTPDVYTTFLKELVLEYENQGLSNEEAVKKAKENLVMTSIPKLPVSGDLSEENGEFTDFISMGGINGYAISAYTKAPNASLAFVEFATSYEMMIERNKYLGIAPVRSDAAQATGELSATLFDNLSEGKIIIMPSIKEIAQIWTPGETYFSDIAKDVFRPEGEKKYLTYDDFETGLVKMCNQIHDAIFTLAN